MQGSTESHRGPHRVMTNVTAVGASGRVRGPSTDGACARAAPLARSTVPAGLWGAQELLRWALTLGLGAIVIAVAWYICAGEATFSQQVGPIDAAVAGLLLAGMGNVGWLLHGRRVLGQRRQALLPDVADVPPVSAKTPFVRPRPGTPGRRRGHGAVPPWGCSLGEGRTAGSAATRQEHESAGRMPCGVCRP